MSRAVPRAFRFLTCFYVCLCFNRPVLGASDAMQMAHYKLTIIIIIIIIILLALVIVHEQIVQITAKQLLGSEFIQSFSSMSVNHSSLKAWLYHILTFLRGGTSTLATGVLASPLIVLINPKFNIIGKNKDGKKQEVCSNKEISKESDKILLLQSFILCFSKNLRSSKKKKETQNWQH